MAAGGTYDDSEGYFVRSTLLVGSDPTDEIFTTEYFGQVLSVFVYDDHGYRAMLAQMEGVSPYALTGSPIAQDRSAIAEATELLRCAAGNFYVNDKPTGAVVGQQPFAVRVPRGPTTRRMPARTSCDGRPPARSRRRSSRR